MNRSIQRRENEIKTKIDEYNRLYDLTYSHLERRKSIKDGEKIAKFINEELDKMTDDEVYKFNKDFVSINKIKSDLLMIELEYFKEDPIKMDLNEFETKAISIFNRYQSNAIGIEDPEWSVHKFDSKEYSVMENELLFENTIAKCDNNNCETEKYLNLIVKRLNNLSEDIDVDIRYSEDNKNNIVWVLIWCTYQKNNNSLISL